MINAIGWLFKITAFSIVILVLGNWIQWNGRSVSDQVKTQIAHAERSHFAGSLRRWTRDVTNDARKGAVKQKVSVTGNARHPEATDPQSSERETPVAVAVARTERSMEKIPSSERQKLRALIQELNTSTSADRRGTR